jgi:hypothetical protein
MTRSWSEVEFQRRSWKARGRRKPEADWKAKLEDAAFDGSRKLITGTAERLIADASRWLVDGTAGGFRSGGSRRASSKAAQEGRSETPVDGGPESKGRRCNSRRESGVSSRAGWTVDRRRKPKVSRKAAGRLAVGASWRLIGRRSQRIRRWCKPQAVPRQPENEVPMKIGDRCSQAGPEG